MKTLKNKKGFTLIELLAVIVVLAIIMVLAMTTVLPYMNDARERAFAVEATGAVDAASQEMTMISIGTHRNGTAPLTTGTDKKDYNYASSTETGVTRYCFSLKKLVELGWWDKSMDAIKGGTETGNGDYEGYVEVTTKVNDNKYTYKVKMRNAAYFVNAEKTDITSDDVNDAATGSGVFDCSGMTLS